MAVKNLEESVERPTKCQKVKATMLTHMLIILIVTGVIIGIAVGLGLRTNPAWKPIEKRKIFFLRFPGNLLMSMLRMLILPLIILSFITSFAGLDLRESIRVSKRFGNVQANKINGEPRAFECRFMQLAQMREVASRDNQEMRVTMSWRILRPP
ncbi:hypothetical protein CHS0354_038771 [Potamilus streckersoni]|uniref:Amino acid transporter n=1 Tax=Potamilus streckersoni TaxID=2493646 RepID=A0AAE0SSA2_9BIVA|nr:hypothetical protein CHS0354_038771 [Potamilus streckersoni]